MFINANSITINNVNMGQYIKEAKFGYHKLWTDAGRNMAGANTGTLIGIFPKITLTFRKLTKDEIEQVIPILDATSQTVTYYDPNKKETVTMATYTGDYEFVNKRIINGLSRNDGFSCAFISIRKRA